MTDTIAGATRHSHIHDGLKLSYLDSAPGDTTRPAVLLLHGFPDEATVWAPQIPVLHAAGFRVLAPDMRGYGESDMAPARGDFLALLDHLGIDQAHVAGHDWGAPLAWMLAGWHPRRVRKLVVMSVGHPTAYARGGITQKLKGWYTVFFQIGGLCERQLLGDGRFSLPRVFPGHPDIDTVMARMRRPGRMTAALRIYRANMPGVLFGQFPTVVADTWGVYTTGDAFLAPDQMLKSGRWVAGQWRYTGLPGGHWMTLEQPERINAILLEHFDDHAR